MANSDDDQITPEKLYINRRFFLRTSIFAGSVLATTGAYEYFRGRREAGEPSSAREVVTNSLGEPIKEIKEGMPGAALSGDESRVVEKLTPYRDITHYNNFYEFSSDKEAVAAKAEAWTPGPWTIAVDGLVTKPGRFDLASLLKFNPTEHIYRLRCVEGWSMVIPWTGFSLSKLLEAVEPTPKAKYVAFQSFFDEKAMPDAAYAGIQFPYVEGLRLDEALHPLTLLATGIYGKPLKQQNGAAVRLVVPWKYGFKSIKSVVKITLTETEPPTTWSLANPQEYGFYSNVNPEVDHPRWSQKQERRIGEDHLRPTIKFNGYGDQVAHLYNGMDLREYF
jgi:sulfoxide reductase catalytic subunit YedY